MMLGATGGGSVPTEPYTIYDYLVSDGNTCFATGYTPNANTSIAPVFGDIPFSRLGKDILIYCNGNNMDCYVDSSWRISHYYNKRVYYHQITSKPDADVYYRLTNTSFAKLTLSKLSDDFAFEDYTSSVRASSASTAATSYKPLYILGNGTGTCAAAGIKFYRLKIWGSGTEVRNYFPAKDNVSGIVGLIEPHTGQFIPPISGNPSVGNI